MLVYDIKTVLILDEPVCVKHLPDQFILRADIPLQEVFLKQIKLPGLRLHGFFCRLCIIHRRFPDTVCLLLLAVDAAFIGHFCRGRPVVVCHDAFPHLTDEVILITDFFFAFLGSFILFSAPGSYSRCRLNHRRLRSI